MRPAPAASGTERDLVYPMETAFAILSFGVVLMACGSFGLLLVRLASPQLRGIGWLSLAFFNGAVGTALLMPRGIPNFTVPAADLCLLSSFVLLHVAVLRVLKRESVPLWPAALLLCIQFAADWISLAAHPRLRVRVLSISLLIAAQSGITAIRLLRARRQKGVAAPALFIAVLLTGFGLFNLVRGVVNTLAYSPLLRGRLALGAFAAYIAVALGIAFGFFWMTTAMLTAEVEETASTDPLTRVSNRRVFLRWCDREIARSLRAGSTFSVLMIDLDHFKQVNDTFGHQTGDEVLCAAVEKMQDAIRGIDLLCRWGGEEFAVLLPNASSDATHLVAERIRTNILKTELSSELPEEIRRGFQLTTSIGAATYRHAGDGVAAMLQRADESLYQAKRTGRNRVLISA